MISKDNYTEKYAFLFERAYYRLAQKTPMYRKMNLVYLNENKNLKNNTAHASLNHKGSSTNEQVAVVIDFEKKTIIFKSAVYYTSLPALFADHNFHDEQFKKQKAQSIQKYPQYFL